MLFKSVLAILAGYILGSFPSAWVAARVVKGRDIRNVGEGNVGTLNTLREVGFIPGLLVFIADAAKGAVAVLLAKWLYVEQLVVFAAGLASVIGHSWSIFLKFRGGRGGATGYGIFLGLAPLAAGIIFLVMLGVMILTSNARLSLITGFTVQPFLIWVFGGGLALILFAVLVPILLGTRMLLVDRAKLGDPALRKNLIFDRNYTWWQSKRNKPSDNKNNQGGKQ